MTDKSATDVIDNVVNKLSDSAHSISDALQKVAPQAWEVAVHQQKMMGLKDMVVGLFFFIIGLISLYYLNKSIFKDVKAWAALVFDGPNPGYFILYLVAFVSGMAALFCGGSTASNGFMKYTNPQYYAIKDLVEIVKPNKNDNN